MRSLAVSFAENCEVWDFKSELVYGKPTVSLHITAWT